MTVIYVPVKIESVEQAEALPVGTPVLEVLTDPGEDERVVGADFIDDGFDEDLTPGSNFHHVALVPIEAEEERDDEWADYGGVNRRRLATPWEAS